MTAAQAGGTAAEQDLGITYPGVSSGAIHVVNGPSGDGTEVVAPAEGTAGSTAGGIAIRPKRFFRSASVNPQRLARDVSAIAKELVTQLTALPGAEAKIRSDVSIRVPGGVPDPVVRTVSENAKTLKVSSADFDAE